MSFTQETMSGYTTGQRYEKKLKFVKMYGNSNNRHIHMRDEDGVMFGWTTTDYTKTYKEFRIKGIYKFTVDYIIHEDVDMGLPHIKIRNLKLVKGL